MYLLIWPKRSSEDICIEDPTDYGKCNSRLVWLIPAYISKLLRLTDLYHCSDQLDRNITARFNSSRVGSGGHMQKEDSPLFLPLKQIRQT